MDSEKNENQKRKSEVNNTAMISTGLLAKPFFNGVRGRIC